MNNLLSSNTSRELYKLSPIFCAIWWFYWFYVYFSISIESNTYKKFEISALEIRMVSSARRTSSWWTKFGAKVWKSIWKMGLNEGSRSTELFGAKSNATFGTKAWANFQNYRASKSTLSAPISIPTRSKDCPERSSSCGNDTINLLKLLCASDELVASSPSEKLLSWTVEILNDILNEL